MKKTVILNENYGKRLRDEIMGDPNNSLTGEVEIQVRDRKTGKIESQEKHNLIVYGGREWLLKKAFCTNVAENPNFIRNSEILWYGVGNGGGEPGNPLQCGCTYGSDNDLYNPVRLRYEFNTNSQSTNPYYASRIMPNGDIVNGYYKKITHVSIKPDQANPYKVNNKITYPNLIAELRLELTPDDCVGQTFLNNDFEKGYADINEAALFIADNRLVDPGAQDRTLTYFTQDYTAYNDNRMYLESGQDLPEYEEESSTRYNWTNDKPFPNLAVQYFNVYKRNGDETDVTKLTKLNIEPLLFGIYKDGTSKTTGYVSINNHKLEYSFVNGSDNTSGSFSIPNDINSLDQLLFSSNGTIVINVEKTDKIEEQSQIQCKCQYRNSYTADYKDITEFKNVFGDNNNTYKYFLPVGYVLNPKENKWEVDYSFTQYSIVRVIQATDFADELVIQEIIADQNSLQCRCYVDNETIKKLSEGMKIYTYNDSESSNKIDFNTPATITDIYDAEQANGTEGTLERSYFIIEHDGFKSEVYTDPVKYPDGGLNCRYYRLIKDSPYIMFNRVTFSTIRMSKSRDVILVWRIYF